MNVRKPFFSDDAISPVVGVMLMLVVVVIVAAVVSGFSGGLVGGGSTKKAPTLAMDVKVVNTGDWHGSGFFATVTSVSEPIPTKDLRIETSWKARERYNSGNFNSGWTADQVGKFITGGSTVAPSASSNINVLFTPVDQLGGLYTAPFGTGPGINGTELLGSNARSYSLPRQQFGNYTLMQGTTLSARPAGAKDADSLGSSGQANSFGGYGASNASYTMWVPGATSTSYCWFIGDPDDDPFPSIYYSSVHPNCLEKWLAEGYREGTSQADCQNTGQCFYMEYGTALPGHDQPVDETKGRKYLYTACGDSCIDPAKAVLGTTWYNLNWGDTVNVKVIHIPTGKVIFQQDVPVSEE